ncbi:unnamed protein product, partial [Ectocarpus sp. 12 AP-2014]
GSTLSDERCRRSGSRWSGGRFGQHCGLCGRAGSGRGVSLDCGLPLKRDGDRVISGKIYRRRPAAEAWVYHSYPRTLALISLGRAHETTRFRLFVMAYPQGLATNLRVMCELSHCGLDRQGCVSVDG